MQTLRKLQKLKDKVSEPTVKRKIKKHSSLMTTLRCNRQLLEEAPVHWAGPVCLVSIGQHVGAGPHTSVYFRDTPSQPALAGLWFGGQLPLPLLLHHFVKLHGGFGVLHRRVAPLPSLRTQDRTGRGVFLNHVDKNTKSQLNFNCGLIWILTTCQKCKNFSLSFKVRHGSI